MPYPDLIGFLSAGLVSISAVVYLWTIYFGDTRPQIGTWFIWTTLSGTTAYSMHEAGAVSYMIITATVLDGAILLTALLYRGAWTWNKFDTACISLALVGIVLRLVFEDPLIVIAFAMAATVLGSVPTMKKALHNPKSELAAAYAVAMASCIVQLMAIPSLEAVHLLQPLIWLLNGATIFGLVIMTETKRANLRYRLWRLSRIGIGE